jgi:hypothetical protein
LELLKLWPNITINKPTGDFVKNPLLSVLLLAIALTAGAQAQSGSGSAATPASDFYPAQLGGRWTFEIEEHHKTKTVSVNCDKAKKINHLDCLHLQSSDSRLSYWVQKKDDGIYVVQTVRSVLGLANLTITFDPPLRILKFPFKKGDHWEYQGWGRTFIASKPLHVIFDNQGLKKIALNGTHYSAFQIASSYQIANDPAQSQLSWYAKGIGFLHSQSKMMEITFKSFSGSPTPGAVMKH